MPDKPITPTDDQTTPENIFEGSLVPGGTVRITPETYAGDPNLQVYFERNSKPGRIKIIDLIGTKDFQDLDPYIQTMVVQMMEANPNVGIGLGGTRRTAARQKALFKERYEPIGKSFDVFEPKNYEQTKKGKYKFYENQWWRLRAGNAPAAVPGASYHEVGLATDLVFASPQDRDWLIANSETFGLRNIPGIGEPWHYQPKGLPDAFLMTQKLMARYKWNPIENPLPQEVLDYVNNLASSAPFRPEELQFLNTKMLVPKVSDPEITRREKAIELAVKKQVLDINYVAHKLSTSPEDSNWILPKQAAKIIADRAVSQGSPAAPSGTVRTGLTAAQRGEQGIPTNVQRLPQGIDFAALADATLQQRRTNMGVGGGGSGAVGRRVAGLSPMSGTPVESNTVQQDAPATNQVVLPPGIDFGWLAAQTPMEAQQWEQAARELFGGYYDVIKDIPELRQLITDAMTNKWSQSQFQYKLEQTQWWKSTNAANRQWIEDGTRDPATQKQNIANRLADIRAIALQRGLQLQESSLTSIAVDSLKFGWNEQTITNAIGAESAKTAGGLSDLSKGYYGQTVRNIATTFGVPLSQRVVDEWTSKIASGMASEQSFQAYVQDLSKNLYPALSAGFDRGLTFKQMTDPYAQVASSILEIPDAQVDFTDPKWAAAFTMKDAKGQQVQMSFGEWADYLRTNPTFGYEYTDGAQEKAYQVANQLARLFGAA